MSQVLALSPAYLRNESQYLKETFRLSCKGNMGYMPMTLCTSTVLSLSVKSAGYKVLRADSLSLPLAEAMGIHQDPTGSQHP